MNQTIPSINKNEISDKIKKLQKIKKELENIAIFNSEKNNFFSNSVSQIDARMNKNNKKSNTYVELKESGKVPDIPQNDLLDILSEHVQINHLKFIMLEKYVEDLYERINVLGKTLNNAIESIIDDLEK